MALVLVSCIGKGRTPNKKEGLTPPPTSRMGYEKVCYRFEEREGVKAFVSTETSLFGDALLQWFKRNGRPVSRWLVMGTNQSAWTELLYTLDEKHQYSLFDEYDALGSVMQAPADGVTQEILTGWETSLRACRRKPEYYCRVVGEMRDRASQYLAWQALLDTVREGDSVVLDITNSLRNLPIITSFMLMALRWLRNIKNIDLYYGAYELGSTMDGNYGCPVVHLDIVPELMEATEAIATFRHTGNYVPLATHMPLTESQKKQLQSVSLSDETNQIDSLVQNDARSLRNSMKRLELSEIEASLVPLLDMSLKWVAGGNLGQQMANKARFAFDNKQYFRAMMLLREAIPVAVAIRYKLGDPTLEDVRKQAEDRLLGELNTDEIELIDKLRIVRNSMAHGTPAKYVPYRQNLRDLEQLQNLFEVGYELLKRLL